MGSSGSKDEETNEIKAVQDMDETELSSQDKLFKKAIVEIYEELKKVKVSKSDNFFYKNYQRSIFVVIHFSKLILLR